MEEKKAVYKETVETLADENITTLVLVSRPEEAPLKEAQRASHELADLGVKNQIPLRAYNITGLENVRSMLKSDRQEIKTLVSNTENFYQLQDLIKSIADAERKVVFTMGKGGVGKTTAAAAIVLGLAHTGTTNSLLNAKAGNEVEWINHIDSHTDGKFALIGWSPDQIKEKKLMNLLAPRNYH